MAKHATIIKLNGPASFPIEQGAHTIFFDFTVFQKEAIIEAIKTYVKRYPKENDTLIAMALGYYKVSLIDIYPEIKELSELNDCVLAEITRWDAQLQKDTLLKVEN